MAFIFNCSHEMALAANKSEYTPPKIVKRMEEDLKDLSSLLHENIIDKDIKVWGWNKAIKHQLIKKGYDLDLMPSDEQIENIRYFASRKYASIYRNKLVIEKYKNSFVENEMQFITDINQLEYSDITYITKTPWSSSGRGIKIVNNKEFPTPPFLIDKFYNKILDFAFEYIVTDKYVEYIGISVFKASTDGKYEYNYVLPQTELKTIIIQQGVDEQIIDYLQQQHKILLKNELIGKYKGIVGIDMMVVNESDTIKIHPCLELNLRMNMGVLAIMLYKQYGDKSYACIGNPNGFQAILDKNHFYIKYNKR